MHIQPPPLSSLSLTQKLEYHSDAQQSQICDENFAGWHRVHYAKQLYQGPPDASMKNMLCQMEVHNPTH